MRPFQFSTAVQLDSFLQQVRRWPLALRTLHQQIAACFARPEPRQHALLYLQAILSDIPRKNGWQIAEHARQARPYGMQRLLSRAVWDEDGVRDDLRALVCQTLNPPSLARTCLRPQHSFRCSSLMKAASPNGAATRLASSPSIAGERRAWKTVRWVSFSPT